VKSAYTEGYAEREPQDLNDQWQACLDFNRRVRLESCPVPIHAIAFSENMQTPPQIVRVVAE